jgi:hypothetical protein
VLTSAISEWYLLSFSSAISGHLFFRWRSVKTMSIIEMHLQSGEIEADIKYCDHDRGSGCCRRQSKQQRGASVTVC